MQARPKMGSVDILSVAKWCLHLARSGGGIIRSVCQSGCLNAVNKDVDGNEFDPTTEADSQTQTWIIGNLRRQFPNLTVIGEEEQDDIIPSSLQCTALPIDIDRDPYFNRNLWPTNLGFAKADDVCIFVDPVDGTTDLTKGKYEAVTVLVGLAISGKPVYGVVHYPFSEETVFAAVGHPSNKLPIDHPRKAPQDNVIVTSASHLDESVQKYFDGLNPPPAKIIRAGGCGHKVMMVLNGLADAYLYPRSGTKKWDTCAPGAIINAFGGRLTDAYGRDLIYDPSAPLNNQDGIMCALTADLTPYIITKEIFYP
uniref:3'(2'),5'-bisphosphate nucleotidase 1 n=1 Tax=Spongospora subterranea TaxID=70186 RepID=A0A0H5RN56_9EUKA|eukprot:CRZ10174.1 hypothetical protein [Spongospora subterranea]